MMARMELMSEQTKNEQIYEWGTKINPLCHNIHQRCPQLHTHTDTHCCICESMKILGGRTGIKLTSPVLKVRVLTTMPHHPGTK